MMYRPVSLAVALGLLVGLVAVTFSAVPAVASGGWVNVQKYLPEGWEDEPQLDLREYIQEALNENAMVYCPGSTDPDNPRLYHITPTLEVPRGARLEFGPHHRIVRLPSEGRLISLQDEARIKGAIIDGNKYAHWPEYRDLGKEGEAAVHFRNHTLIEDVVVYNNPGHAFSSRGDYNRIYRCRAENIGYVDLKHGRSNYASAYDGSSGDGFYLRGEGNLVKDSESYDAFRWGFCSSHSGARQNVYVDCRGGDVNFRTYGFIDIEDAEDNNRLIRCISPNSRIAIPVSARTEVIQSMASFITVWDRAESIERYGGYENVSNHGVLLNGNITTTTTHRYGGIGIGGRWTRRDDVTPGASSPIVVNNRMYKGDTATAQRVDWSFSVYSMDGHGVIANNLLFEYEDREEDVRGPGINLENIEGSNDQVIHGKWQMDLPRPSYEWGYVEDNDELQGQRPPGY